MISNPLTYSELENCWKQPYKSKKFGARVNGYQRVYARKIPENECFELLEIWTAYEELPGGQKQYRRLPREQAHSRVFGIMYPNGFSINRHCRSTIANALFGLRWDRHRLGVKIFYNGSTIIGNFPAHVRDGVLKAKEPHSEILFKEQVKEVNDEIKRVRNLLRPRIKLEAIDCNALSTEPYWRWGMDTCLLKTLNNANKNLESLENVLRHCRYRTRNAFWPDGMKTFERAVANGKRGLLMAHGDLKIEYKDNIDDLFG